MTTTEERPVTMVPVLRSGECGCTFDRDPEMHDLLLGIEDLSALRAATVIADLILNDGNLEVFGGECGDLAFFREGDLRDEALLFDDPGDFGRFIIAHNWRDPAAMAWLAGSVDRAAEQAWKHRGARAKGAIGC